jgi:hypothetical protein
VYANVIEFLERSPPQAGPAREWTLKILDLTGNDFTDRQLRTFAEELSSHAGESVDEPKEEEDIPDGDGNDLGEEESPEVDQNEEEEIADDRANEEEEFDEEPEVAPDDGQISDEPQLDFSDGEGGEAEAPVSPNRRSSPVPLGDSPAPVEMSFSEDDEVL